MQRLSRTLALLAGLVLVGGPAMLAAAPLAHDLGLVAPVAPDASPGNLVAWLGAALVVFGAIRMADVGTLAQKFASRAGAAAGDYKTGVAQAGQDWEQQTAASEPNYQAGVNAGIARGAYGKGIRASGAAKYVRNATEKGAVRYGPGVQAAKDDWAKGFAPVAQVIQSVALPPPGPKRSPQNMLRANAMAEALGKWKESQ